ncbi:MAG TPA: cbb3-type cytochrome c oxidase subunit I, partial [Mycobacterium sp.]|nr:cbb3-type cytochrome c oxidase subunit I [Mycobacterium sp.]
MTTLNAPAVESRSGWGRLWYVLWPVIRGTLWACIGYALGAGITSYVLGQRFQSDQALVVGYIPGLLGWLAGIGGWEAIVKPMFGGETRWDEGDGAARYFRFNTDHKVIGLQVLFYTTGTFLMAGLAAMNMRAELATARLNWFSTPQQYLSIMSVHGTLMMFAVATVALFSGIGHYVVPLQIGARRMVFPRLEALTFWLFPAGVTTIIASLLVGGYQTGWTAYEPLASVDQRGQLFYAMGAATVILASTLTAVNMIGTVVFLRARGLSWRRVPVSTWAQFATAFLNWFWFAVIALAMILLITDRTVATNFFRGYSGAGTTASGNFAPGNYSSAGYPLLWQDLFWLFSHPEVYI